MPAWMLEAKRRHSEVVGKNNFSAPLTSQFIHFFECFAEKLNAADHET